METSNLLFVTYLVNKEYFVRFGVSKCEISKGRIVIGKIKKRRSLWNLQGAIYF